jgi:transposase
MYNSSKNGGDKMNQIPMFFEQIMGIIKPWYIKEIKQEGMDIHIKIDFEVGSRFEYGGEKCSIHDTVERTWRHLNLFQYKAYITARVPRVKTKGGVKQVEVPWGRKGSGFTLLFEAFILQLAMCMSVSEVSRLMGEHENRLWRIVDFYTEQEIGKQDFSLEPIVNLAIDEISRKKGHVYLTNFLDVERKKVVFVARGKDSHTLESFKEAYLKKSGKEKDIKTISMDMSPAFIKGAKETFPKAKIIFDKFHVIKALNEQLDLVRRREQKTFADFFKKTKYLFLKTKQKLTAAQSKKLTELLEDNSKDTVQAYNLLQSFKEVFNYSKPSAAGRYLQGWQKLCEDSGIPEMISASKTVFNHIYGILEHIRTKITNAMLEGLNSKLRVITKRAYGFKRFAYLRTMIFLNLGKLHFVF